MTTVRGRLVAYWRSITLPYPEPGLRLIRQQDIAGFDVHLTTARAELEESVWRLDEHYAELRSAARDRLGSLFDARDYPESLQGLFAVAWDYPSIEPPAYLQQLSPALFEQEQARVAARFDEAVQMAEDAFTSELSKLISHLTERLSGTEDGKPKVFRDSAIDNLHEFFERFRTLNVRSNEQLDALVEQARRVVRGIAPQELRERPNVRQQVATQLAGVQSVLDGLMIDRPRRNIQRRPH